MTLRSYFMSKSVFGQQDCRALTFALAELSCYNSTAVLCYSRVGVCVIFNETRSLGLTRCNAMLQQLRVMPE